MALSPKLSNEAVNAGLDAILALLDNGYLRIYSGAKPTSADTALGAQVLLAELRFGTPAFGAAVAGVAAANALTGDTAANATGTASFFRATKADGTSVILDGTVGTSAADLIMGSVALQSGAPVDVTAFTVTMPKG